MAHGSRDYVPLECIVCGNRNYYTQKKTGGGSSKMQLKKYCKFCRRHTKHKEKKKR